jgi:hypothetical protein
VLPPGIRVGTNSRANGFGWNPGVSLRVVTGEDVPESGRDGSLDCGMGEKAYIVGGYGGGG